MTNEELVELYYAGEETRLQLYNKIRNLIAHTARRIAASYYCMQYTDRHGTRTTYTKQILEDLRDEGMMEFFRVLDLRQYDPAKAKFTTYIVPFLDGAMRRWMESNLGCLSVSKDDMERIREIQRAYHSEGKSVLEIAAERGLTVEAVQRDIGYNTHLLPFSALSDQDGSEEADDIADRLLVDENARSVDTEVYYRICVKKLEPLFRELMDREQFILGSTYGAFGFEELSDDDIAFELELSDEGVRRARIAALEKLHGMVSGSRLEEWQIVHKAVLKECRRDYDCDVIDDEEYGDRPKIGIHC